MTLLFRTSFVCFNPHILEVAPKYPDVRFQHASGLRTNGMPTSLDSYLGYVGKVVVKLRQVEVLGTAPSAEGA